MTGFKAPFVVCKLGLLTAGLVFSHLSWAAGGHSHSHGHSHNVQGSAAHVHGTGEMELVLDGNNLSITLYSPLHNVLGFEHAPKTDTERVKARRVVSLLKANGLFAFSPDAQCKTSGHRLVSDILNPHSHGPNDDHKDHDGDHSDLRAVFEFECENPQKLKTIDVRLFRQFPAFQKIELQALFPSGQQGASLTPSRSMLTVQ
jgi:hypothetical protein